MPRLVSSFLVLLAAAVAPPDARAETQLCTKINALPAVITSQGPYCLGKALSTAMTSGVAITIAANNVTLDCNGYRLGGVAGGEESTTIGISSEGRQNTVIRNCTVRGFAAGIALYPDGGNNYGGGLIVENNRVDGTLQEAITVFGHASVVRDNIVIDTGLPLESTAVGIRVEGNVDVIDNVIEGVGTPGISGLDAFGIYTVTNQYAAIDGNRVREVYGGGDAGGIWMDPSLSLALTLRDNVVTNASPTTGTAIDCGHPYQLAVGNQTSGYSTALDACTDGGGNENF